MPGEDVCFGGVGQQAQLQWSVVPVHRHPPRHPDEVYLHAAVCNLSAEWYVGFGIDHGTGIKQQYVSMRGAGCECIEIGCLLNVHGGATFQPMAIHAMRLIGIEKPTDEGKSRGDPHHPQDAPECPFFLHVPWYRWSCSWMPEVVVCYIHAAHR